MALKPTKSKSVTGSTEGPDGPDLSARPSRGARGARGAQRERGRGCTGGDARLPSRSGHSAACSLGRLHCFAVRWLPARPPTVGARTTDRPHSLRRGGPVARARRAWRGAGARACHERIGRDAVEGRSLAYVHGAFVHVGQIWRGGWALRHPGQLEGRQDTAHESVGELALARRIGQWDWRWASSARSSRCCGRQCGRGRAGSCVDSIGERDRRGHADASGSVPTWAGREAQT